MVFRTERLQPDEQNAAGKQTPSGFRVVLDVQSAAGPPQAVVFQAAHSRLAGDVARALRPELFGELPAEVISAIAEHDAGWQATDEAQLSPHNAEPMKPFIQVPAEKAFVAWRESVRRAESASPLQGIVVSRHFCALTEQDPGSRAFADEANPHREEIERRLGMPASDLDRWTAAIGFCDVVSLYLCCGTRRPAEIALAHPALPQARDAQKVRIEWSDGQPRFASPVLAQPLQLSVEGFQLEQGIPKPLRWEWLLGTR